MVGCGQGNTAKPSSTQALTVNLPKLNPSALDASVNNAHDPQLSVMRHHNASAPHICALSVNFFAFAHRDNET